jgi:probable phosphoglycerate mutase
MKTTVVAVRHGESISNLNKTFTGQWDVPLTALGINQAERTAAFLDAYPITALYSSDLMRAMQTAEPTAKKKGIAIIPDARLREIHGGDWQQRVGTEIAKMYPESYKIWKTDVVNGHPDGGESFYEVMARMRDAFSDIVSRHRGECVAIFSHAGAFRTLMVDWFGPDVDDRNMSWMTNASVSVIEYDDDGTCNVILYSYDGHQGDAVTKLSKELV